MSRPWWDGGGPLEDPVVDGPAADARYGGTTDREPERPPSRAQRRERSTEMVGVLARALAGQVAALAAASDPAPDGWWFTPDRRG